MIFNRLKTGTAIALIFTMLFVQVFAFVSVPKPAKAIFGIGDITFNTEIGNWYDVIKDIGIAAAKRIALNFTNRYLQRFINQLLDKYKIRNYLYYTRVLSNYYLSNYVREKIDDPDLRRAYTILQAQFVNFNINPIPNQRQASEELRRQLKITVDDIATKQGVIMPGSLQNFPPGTRDEDKFMAAQASYAHSREDLEQKIVADFSGHNAASNDAANLEIGSSSDGFKSSRASVSDPITNTQIALSAIQNPGRFASEFASGAVNVLLDSYFNPNNGTWATALGNSLGNFLFGKLGLDGTNNILNEYSLNYASASGTIAPGVEIDLDGDGFFDGQDTNGDNQIDNCYHGGTAPGNCTPSSQAGSSAYFTPLCQALDRSITNTEAFYGFLQRNSGLVNGDNFQNEADADLFARRALLVTSALDELINSIENYRTVTLEQYELTLGRYVNYLSKVVDSLFKDGDLDLARIGNGGGGIDNLVRVTGEMLNYLVQTKAEIGRCDAPNFDAIANIPPPDIDLPPGEGGGGTCADPGNSTANHDDALQAAIDAVIDANPDGIADATNTRENAFIFIGLVADQLNNTGYNASIKVLNGNDNPQNGDLVAVWLPGENVVERYDILTGVGDGDDTIGNSLTLIFTGDIPLSCVTP